MSETEKKTEREIQLEADLEKQRGLTQTWMGKATHYEKSLNGKSIESVIEAAKERDILAHQSAGGDPKKIEEEVERGKKSVRDELTGHLDGLKNENTSLKNQVKEYRVVDGIVAKVGSDIYQKANEDFRAYIRTHCDENEKGEIVVKDSKGNVRYSPEKPNQLMSVDELIKELKTERDHWFVNKTVSGNHDAANRGSVSSGKITTWAELSKLSPEQSREVLAKLTMSERLKIRDEARAAGIEI